ncbi:MAG: HAD family hydrolase [Myxococcaceae bacterium]
MPFEAAVFDLDGTLVDNIRFHVQAWMELGERLGIPVTRERFEREFSGRKNDEIFPALLGRPVPPDELERLADEKESRYRELFRPHLKLLAGAEALIAALTAKGVKLAIASAAPRANRDFVLDGLELRGRFQAIIGSEDAKRGKPSPDLFLAAAAKLGVAPEKCIAFEDAELGVQAARAAGMTCAAVTTTATEEQLRHSGAQYVAADFATLPRELRSLLGV